MLITRARRELCRSALVFPLAGANRCAVHPLAPMADALAIHGHEIIDLVASHPEGIRLGQLMETVAKDYGRMATFHTGSAHGLDLDGLLRYLEARQKVRIVRGVVFPGGSRGLSK